MKNKKEMRSKSEKQNETDALSVEKITNCSELKSFLLHIRDKMEDGEATPLYAVTAMNFALNTPDVYAHLNEENKEIARAIWLRLKQSGLQLRSPSLLFSEEDKGAEPSEPSR